MPDLNPNTQAPVSRVTPEGFSFLATRNNGPWEKHTVVWERGAFLLCAPGCDGELSSTTGSVWREIQAVRASGAYCAQLPTIP